MKVYFIFDIKQEFVNLYLENGRILFNILRNIYFLEKEEVNFGYNLFKQLINPINNNLINREIFIKCHKDIPYSKRDNTHYINNLYKDEISRLLIKNSYMKLEIENKKTSFLDIISPYSKNYFVCDFKNYDYFFLNHTDLTKINTYMKYNKVLV